jgi:hypothetical protein
LDGLGFWTGFSEHDAPNVKANIALFA